MTAHLSDADRESLMSVGYIEYVDDSPEWAALLNDLDPVIEAIVARAIARALTEAVDAIESLPTRPMSIGHVGSTTWGLEYERVLTALRSRIPN